MNAWAVHEISRIKALSDTDLINEVHNAINGSTYSWLSIHEQLQKNKTEYSLFREWSYLCDLKRGWESYSSDVRARLNGKPFHAESVLSTFSGRSLWKPNSHRALLLNLKLLPIHAGLGIEAVQLVSRNVDGSQVFTVQDLWIDCERWELNYVDRKWVEGDMKDEEEPLLGYGGGEGGGEAGGGSVIKAWAGWSWRKWF